MMRSAETWIDAMRRDVKGIAPGKPAKMWAGKAGRDQGGEGAVRILARPALDVQDESLQEPIGCAYGSSPAQVSGGARRGAPLHARGRPRAHRPTRIVPADPPA